jgi:hypothetical protein
MRKRPEIEVTQDVFEKTISKFGLRKNRFIAGISSEFDDYWHEESTGLTLARRFNGYSDDPKSVPRYFLDEWRFTS